MREVREVREVRGVREVREVRGVRKVRGVREVREVREVRGVREVREVREVLASTMPVICSNARRGARGSLFVTFVLVAAAASLAAWQPPEPGVHPLSGRRIAPVMSHTAADWLDRPERVAEEQPDRALGVIGVRPGQIVADVGAGSGYYTVRLARRVAPGGKVYATDIQPEMLELLGRRLKRERIDNVVPVLATATDPKLPDAALDLVLMVDVYHELSQPQNMLRQLRRALAPGGRLVLIEFRKEDPRVPIRPEHKMSVSEARLEVEAEGFRLAKVSDVLPWQHVLIFDVASQAGH